MLLHRRSLILAGAAALTGPVLPGLALAQGDRNHLAIVTQAGVRHVFTLEIADSPEMRARGLMFRRELAPDRGMLFDFGPGETDVSMWMKNTYIPLDMVFIRADGLIRRIAENTTPLSERTIPSGGPVKGVLEVIGGTAQRLGFAAGDRVEHPFFRG